MKIKSLLLGSAAALVAVTGARAADAVIVEPEPVEYVRICDAYGSGFFYIPGTETCLKFSGYVRVDWQSRHQHEAYETTVDTHQHRWQYRGRLNIDARNETEYGTLRSQLRFQGDGGNSFSFSDTFSDGDAGFHGSGDANAVIDRALISLAGFRLGYSDDYWTTIGGYGYFQARNDGLYSYGQNLFFDYTYAADGFTLTVGAQGHAGGTGIAGQPDLYVGGDYSGSWGRVFGTYYYDSSTEGSAWKAGVQLSLADYIPGGAIKGWYMADDGETDYVKGHAWGVTAQMNLIDNWSLYGGYSDYDEVFSTVNAGTAITDDDSRTQWTAGLTWKAAPGLSVQFEYAKTNYDYQITGSRVSSGLYGIRVVRSF